jgi:hypothetical protein
VDRSHGAVEKGFGIEAGSRLLAQSGRSSQNPSSYGKSYANWKCLFPGAGVSAEIGGQETAKIDGRVDCG